MMRTQKKLAVVLTSLLSLLVPCARAITSARASAQGERVVRLTVTVTDAGGGYIPAAHVNVYQAHPTAHDFFPPDYQADTDARGVASFEIRVKGRDRLFIEVSREGFQTGGEDVDALRELPTEVKALELTKTFRLAKRGDEAAAAETTTFRLRVVRAGDADAPVEGAKVVVWLATAPARKSFTAQTDRNGEAVIITPLFNDFEVTAFKERFGQVRRLIRSKDYPKTVGPLTLALERQAGAEVTLSVRDEENHNLPVADADIVLNGVTNAGFYSVTTDGSGNATIFVPEIGSFKVRISQDFYESFEGEARLLQGDEKKTFEFFVKAKKKSEKGADTVEVTVLKKEEGGEGRTSPLAGARVRIGAISTGTDADGRAALKGSYDFRENVTVEAEGYKSQTKSVGIAKLGRYSGGTGSATFILEPDLNDSTPVRLVVEVRSAAAPNSTLEGANVLLRSGGTIIGQENTNAQGEASFELKESSAAPLARLRTGIRLDVAKEKYRIRYSDITPDLLAPSTHARRVTVFLERDWADLRAAVAALEPRVLAWNGDITLAGNNVGVVRRLAEQAPQAAQRSAAMLKEVGDAGVIDSGVMGVSVTALRCQEAARLKSNIQSYRRDAAAKEQTLRTKLDGAAQLAAGCSTPKDADAVRAAYREAIQLAGAIGVLEKKALADNQRLKELASERGDRAKIVEAVERKVAELREEAAMAAQAAATAGAYFVRADNLQKTLYARHQSLAGELAALKAAHGLDKSVEGVPADLVRRVEAMEGLIGRQNNNVFSGPAVEWVKTVQDVALRVRADKDAAEGLLARYKGVASAGCDLEPLDDAVQEIASATVGATVELGAAAGLNDKAQVCVANNTQPANDSPKRSADRPQVEELPEDDSGVAKTGDGTKEKGREPRLVDEIRGRAPAANTHTSATPQGGGFWDAAKAGKGSVVDKVSNKPSRGDGRTPAVEEIPEDGGGAVAAGNRGRNGAGKPAPKVEEIPDGGGAPVASNRPARGGNSRQPAVEEIPEDSSSSTRPGGGSPRVEEIPESTSGSGGRGGDSAQTAANRPAQNPKPKGPGKGERLGGILRGIATAINQPPAGNPTGGSPPSDRSSSGGVGGGGLPPGVRPCTADEAALFAQMTGTWQTPMGPKVTIGGSCEQATGRSFFAEYCENPDSTYNTSLPRYQADFTGRMSGDALQFEWTRPDRPDKGSGSCYLRGDGTLSCSGVPCGLSGKKQ